MKTKYSMRDYLFCGAIFATLLALALLLFANIHGKYRDAIADKMHDDCIMCSIYRWSHSDDPAFAIREAKRNNKE